ncbi:putative regulatory protein, FmdB family [Streptomyces sp. DvalAA-14]|uniref:FmdB family zinc ribbon protein n=1 Tax=unclassified Streptomyces TaxID=2593676 RepID=UPI00081AEC52|nr:FmdB family zinc ribbon protein [Streptomyces sp. DvalAA-14]MYS21336.1 FmdB family transcriptional regulator [Streptomyces sp. SID4948]SCD90118.1 putative regulatory protein, FmdB family [Streptomyces sp. DvalAA-14]
MPTYQYQCTECGEALEAVQKFSDDALTVCPNCAGRLRKVFSAVGVVFKGSGFYRTDSRGSSTSTAPAAKSSAGSDNKSSDSGSSSSSSSSSGSSSSGSSTGGSSSAATPSSSSTSAA